MRRVLIVALLLSLAFVAGSGYRAHAASVLFGDQTLEAKTDYNAAGTAEAFSYTASASGSITSISIYVDSGSSATALSVGIYTDAAGHPGSLLTSGRLSTPTAAAWNTVTMPAASVTAGSSYWIALLGSGGTLRFRDHGRGGTPADVSAQTTLDSLPPSWASGGHYSDGPASAYANAAAGPVLTVTPATIELAAVAGAAPATAQLLIADAGGSGLAWTATASPSWLTVAAAAGTAPATLVATATPGVLAPGTYSGAVTVTAAGATGSPMTIPVTFSVSSADTAPPVVAIGTPADGATVAGTQTVTASASDDVAVTGVQFRLDGSALGAEIGAPPYSIAWDTTVATSGGHVLTAVARDAAGHSTTSPAVAVTVDNGGASTAFLGGDQTIEPSADHNNAGTAEAFQITASSTGTITQIQVYVDPLSTASALTAGLYSDAGGHPGALLAQGALNAPPAGGWDAVPVTATSIESGTKYWIALLSPAGTGTLRFRDRCCGGGGPAEASAQSALGALPATWQSGAAYRDAPVSAWAAGLGAALPPADQVGRWSSPQSWPLVAVHMALLPTGNVVTWDGFAAAPNSERIWNPATGSFLAVPYGRNLFCAGQILLPDGKVLVTGGHVAPYDGLADTTIFDPATDTWTRVEDMSAGRWYPTVIELGDGRALVFSGDHITQDIPGQAPPMADQAVDSLPEIFDPVTQTWTDLTSARLSTPLYPFLFQLSNGRVLDAGPDLTTRLLDTRTGVWSTVGTSAIDGMSAVMYRPDKIMKSGSWAEPDFSGAAAYAPTNRAQVLDMTRASPAWTDTGSMAYARSYQDLTVLPDGTVLATGGESNSDGTDITKAVLPAEVWNPTTGAWTTLAAEQIGREYHSTALLLPDGRVLVAGGGQLPNSPAVNETNAEVYSPPYLFKGARPTISSAPSLVQYGADFTVSTPDAASIASVALVRTGAPTHGFDMNQRFLPLSFTPANGSLTVTAPQNGNVAPPGYYMLFLVNGSGVPSVASFVRLPAPWEDTQPPTAPTGLAATAGAGSVLLSWSPSTDNVGVAAYDVYRSPVSGFAPSSTNLVARVAGTGASDDGLAPGTYYYVVRAEDAAGNLGPPSSQAAATVAGDTTPPVVAITAPTTGTVVSGTVSVTASASDDSSVAGVQFELDGAALGSEATSAPYRIDWNTSSAANGVHSLTAIARDSAGNTTTSQAVAVTVSNSIVVVAALVGDQSVEAKTDSNVAGVAEAFKTTGSATGTLNSIAVYVDPLSAATAVTAGVYTDASGHPGALLAQGTVFAPTAGWNTIGVPGAAIANGAVYWIALLAPAGSGTLRFRDRCCGLGGATEVAGATGASALPPTWPRGSVYKDGPMSAWGGGSIP